MLAGAIAPVVLARQIWSEYVRTDRQPAGLAVWSGFVVALVGGPWLLVWVLNRCEENGRTRLAQGIAIVVWTGLAVSVIVFVVFAAMVVWITL
jgi:hypothetical protein